jgi:hypothetical protein
MIQIPWTRPMKPVTWMWGTSMMIWRSECFSEGTCYGTSWAHDYTCSVFEDYDSYVFSYRSTSWGSNQ